MQEDFHYYATYCAALLAGYTHEESMQICTGAQLVDLCSDSFLNRLHAPKAAATTQQQLEMMDARTDLVGLQNITRIWASFHFLPRDLYAEPVRGTKRFKNKYRLICGPNGELLEDTVRLAKDKPLTAAGIAMHVLADTWAHRYFAGTPSLVINDTNYFFYELVPKDGGIEERQITFRHKPGAADDPEQSLYTATIRQNTENSIMNLGHGRAGHLPDYSFARYRYLPAWKNYEAVLKDNPKEYMQAFAQMVYALQYLHGDLPEFVRDTYAYEIVEPHRERIKAILEKRQPDACEDWRVFGEELSGRPVTPFALEDYQKEYTEAAAAEKDNTWLGRFFLAAMAQKSMVTNKIFKSGNKLAGYSIEASGDRVGGIRDYRRLTEYLKKENLSHDETAAG